MNYRHISSSVLAGFLLLHVPFAFGVNCGLGYYAASSTLNVTVENKVPAPGRPVLVIVNSDNGPNNNTAYALYGTTRSAGPEEYSVSGGFNATSASGPFVATLRPNSSDQIHISTGAAYCDNTGEGTFGVRVVVEGVTFYIQEGGLNQYPNTYYGMGNISSNSPLFAHKQSVPPDANNGTMMRSNDVWLYSNNDTSLWANASFIKFAFSLPQRDSGVVYDPCPAQYFPAGPLCYKYTFGNDDFRFAKAFVHGTPYQNDTIDIIVNDHRAINQYRTQLNIFDPTSYDVPNNP